MKDIGDLAQMVERSLSMREALGSMPRFSSFEPLSVGFNLGCGPLARALKLFPQNRNP